MKTKLKSITVSNFMSYGQKPQTFDLDQVGSRLILGENKDIGEAGKSRNGCGKTNIFNSILFCLFGKGIDHQLKADEYINLTNGKRMSVSLLLSVGNTDYQITRTRKPNSVTLEAIQGDTVTNLTHDSMANTDKHIVSLIGYDYDVFVMLFFMSPTKKSFMSMTGAEQRDMIEKILSLDVLVQRAEAIKEISKGFKDELLLAQRDLDHARQTYDTAKENEKNYIEKFEKFEFDRMEKLNSAEAALRDIDTGLDVDAISTKLDRMDELNSMLASLKQEQATHNATVQISSTTLQRTVEKLAEIESVKVKNKNELETIKSKITEINHKLSALPSVEDCNGVIDEWNTTQQRLNADIATAQDKLNRAVSAAKSAYEHNYRVETNAKRHEQYIADVAAQLTALRKTKVEEYPFTIDHIDTSIEIIDVVQQSRDLQRELLGKKSKITENIVTLTGLMRDDGTPCPTCGSSHSTDKAKQSLAQQIEQLTSEQDEISDEISKLEHDIEGAMASISIPGEHTSNSLYKLRSNVVEANNTANEIARKIAELEATESPFLPLGELIENVDDLSNNVNVFADDLAAAKKELEEQVTQFESDIISVRSDIKFINTLRSSLTELETKSTVLIQRLDELTREHEQLTGSLVALGDKATLDRSNLDAIAAQLELHTAEFSSIHADLGGMNRDTLNRILTQIPVLKETINALTNQANPFEEIIESIVFPDLPKFEDEVKRIDNLITHASYLVRLLTDNKSFIRKNIVDQYLPFFNKKLAEYTRGLDLPHTAKLNSDMSVEIEYMTKTLSYYNLSAGERLRLNTATTAAFKDLIGMMGKSSNLLMVDEIDASLDMSGMNKAFTFIKSITESLLVISHRKEFFERVDDLVTIVKSNGFSEIRLG